MLSQIRCFPDSRRQLEAMIFHLAIGYQTTTTTFVSISRAANGSPILLVNLKGGDCSIPPSGFACYVSTRGCLYPPALRRCRVQWIFFSRSLCGRRPDSSSVRVTSSRHPRISCANLFMGDARGGMVCIVYRRRSYTTLCIAMWHVPANDKLIHERI